MAPVALVFTIFATYFCFANGQSACSTPDGSSGTCKSLFECYSILGIFKNPNKTQADIDFLKKSKCGFDGNIPKVCCENPCYTPEGKPGKCVSIYYCAHLAKLIQPPLSEENVQYIRNSKCTGKEKYSVCCGPPRDTSVVVPAGDCSATVSAFPADPKTECCGVDSSAGNKIVGGTPTAVDQYPWLVIMEHLNEGEIKLLCGGVLISQKYVLTAGHCVIGNILKIGTPKNVRLGEYDTRNNGKDCVQVEAGGEDCTDGAITIPIESYIAHPNYISNENQSPFDIALLRLLQLAPFTDFIRPICLPTTDVTLNPPPPQSFTLYASGWGNVSTTHPFSNVKLHVDLPYVGNDICEEAYKSTGRNVKLTKGHICAGGISGKDSCKGDSGGPLMFENGRTWEVIGIISFGPTPCGLPNIPGVHTKVWEYMDWIKSVIVA